MYCEKCGNKIKEGYKFCDKCGTKVKENIKKLEENKEVKKIEEKKVDNKIEKNKEITINNDEIKPVVYGKQNNKKGKGKFIFLIILNLLLLASTIVFLVLWLTKPSEKSCRSTEEKTSNYSNSSDKKDNKDAKKDSKDDSKSTIVGKWEQNVDYKQGNEVVKRTYGMIELKNDGSFNSVFYDKDNMSDSERLNGTYTSSGNTVYLKYKDEDGDNQTATLYIENDKMCIKQRDCEDYLVKRSYNNKVVIYEDESDIEFINYSDYQKIINNKESAIVVVVRDGCYYCEQYESVVEKIHENYFTPVYYYENDNNIEVTGTPTTFVIKNGEIVDTIIGYYEYSKVEERLDKSNVF